jgi:phosphoribosylanthranilate isomerase
MSRIAIKICGIKDRTILDAAIGAGATHVGFVHFPKSPRHMAANHIQELIRVTPRHIKTVVLLVDPDPDLLEFFANDASPDIIQLHGDESASQVGEMHRQFPLEFWKAIPVSSSQDLYKSRQSLGAAQRVLFDAKPPAGAAAPGGNAVRIDWELLRGYRETSMPWGLAGGLDPANVGQAIRTTRAPLVDVSSGVESAPGIKDVDKIAAFCKAVQSL